MNFRLLSFSSSALASLSETSVSMYQTTRHYIREDNHVYKTLIGRPEGKKSLERPSCRWEDNIKMDVKVEGCRVWNESATV
jgi:hypothetical protein